MNVLRAPAVAFVRGKRIQRPLGLRALRCVILAASAREVHRGPREPQVQPLHVFDDDPRDREVPKPFVVGGDDEPRSVRRAAPREGVFVRLSVVAPELSLLIVRLTDLPSLGRIVEARPEAPQLLFLGDVQVELQNVRPRSGEFLFESVDLVLTARPYRLRD